MSDDAIQTLALVLVLLGLLVFWGAVVWALWVFVSKWFAWGIIAFLVLSTAGSVAAQR